MPARRKRRAVPTKVVLGLTAGHVAMVGDDGHQRLPRGFSGTVTGGFIVVSVGLVAGRRGAVYGVFAGFVTALGSSVTGQNQLRGATLGSRS